uniref:Programmed cell death 6-interacting protein n=1 Tax=Cacopsylla melanoneura TaxID=428564 RepID=A0A8D8W3V9_9HEMI
MAEFLAVPLKKPTDVDIIKPLKNLISLQFPNDNEKLDILSEKLNLFNKLRTAAVWKVFEKHESSLEVIYSYYDHLVSLESKIFPATVNIPFRWKDAFNKGSLFGGRISLTVCSLAWERVCVLFNIAALQSAIAQAQSLDTDEGLKLSAKMLQSAAGIFSYLKGAVVPAIQQDPTPDMNADTLAALSTLMLAQAQETFVHKAIHDRMKDAILAKLCAQCEDYYADAMRLMSKDSLKQMWDKEWVQMVSGKQAALHAMTHYYQGLVCKQNKEIGEEIARLQCAVDLFREAQARSGRPQFFEDILSRAQRNLAEALKDNDFIYHERIPDIKSIEPVGKASIAKSLPLPTKFSAKPIELFEFLVPMVIHQSMAGFEQKKSDIVNGEIGKLRESTQLMNTVLSSLNLPASLEDTQGTELPASLQDKSQAVINNGGIQKLESLIRELPDLLQRNTEILNECDRMINEEKTSDDQLKSQFRERWTRTPSSQLTQTFQVNLAKYREIINNAINADKVVRENFETHRQAISLLSQGPAAMTQALPSCNGSTNATNCSAAQQLRHLMEEVETIKATRDVIESELKSSQLDMKERFMKALIEDGAVTEKLATDALQDTYGALQNQVRESVARQDTLLSQIQEKNSEFTAERMGGGNSALRRDQMLKQWAAGYDAFMDLQKHLQEGAKFYNDLTELLVVFQNKINDFCFARKTEKEELMKDLTQDLSRGPVGLPSAPSSHNKQDNPDSKRDPPARPPPPQAPPSTPYPTMPQGMPVPYAMPGQAPYPMYMPAPMPQTYNPYATLPGPGQYPQNPMPGQQNPAYPMQGYMTYPGPQGGYQYPQYPPHQ